MIPFVHQRFFKSVIWPITLVVFAILCGAAVQPASAQDIKFKAVYRDANFHTNWNDADVADAVTAFFQKAGYEVLDEKKLRPWLDARIADRERAVLVNAHDTFPDSALDPAGDTKLPSPNNPIRRFLLAGGRILNYGDIPFYLHATDDTRNEAGWADAGATAILGRSASATDGRDIADSPTITDEGKAWGLTQDVPSIRPELPSNADIILSTTTAGRAASWIQKFSTVAGRGEFIRLADRDLSVDDITPELLADFQRVAEYSPAGTVNTALDTGIQGTITADGKPLVGINVQIKDEAGKVTVWSSTDSAGKYFAYLTPGSYTVLPNADPSSGSAAPKVLAVEAGKIIAGDFSLAKYPTATLTKDGIGSQWKIYLSPDVDPTADFSAANADESKFEEWDLETNNGDWSLYLADKGIDNANMDGWLRLHFKLPAEFAKYKGGDLRLFGFSFNASDETFFNGQRIGETGLLVKDTGGPVRDADTIRNYVVPASAVSWDGDNVIAIHGWHDAGTGAFKATRPQLTVVPPPDLPKFQVVQEVTGNPWLILLDPSVDPNADYSAGNADESKFAQWDLNGDSGDWSNYLTKKGIANANMDGWLRMHFKLPADWNTNFHGPLLLTGFSFNASDETFFNGVSIGETGKLTKDPGGPVRDADTIRNYTVPETAVNWTGDNVIAIHGWHDAGTGAFKATRPELRATKFGSASSVVKGDLNGDGKVNIADATMALQFAVGNGTPTAAQIAAGDVVGGDGKIGIPDVTKILQAAIGAITL